MIELNKIYNEDCLQGMKRIPDKSVDMILCDLPYGTTDCAWDTIIPLEPLWEQYERIIKDNGAIVLTSRNPFTTVLNASNLKLYRYELIWEKEQATNFLFIKKQFGSSHENISVFYKKQPKYNPQMIPTDKPVRSNGGNRSGTHKNQRFIGNDKVRFEKYPCSVLRYNRDKMGLHPTQKPVALFEMLIRSYTDEGDTVLDNCMGSGTTAVACMNTNRNYIGFELDENYHRIATERIEKELLSNG